MPESWNREVTSKQRTEAFPLQRLGKQLLSYQQVIVCMITQLFDKVFHIQFAKNCLKRVTGRLQISFPKSWKEAKVITLPKPGKNPKSPQNLRPINLLSATGKLFEKVILNIVQKHIEEKSLLNASQFGFRARHSTTLQCMRLTDHVTGHLNGSSCRRPEIN
jgi:hypothetical protein